MDLNQFINFEYIITHLLALKTLPIDLF